MKVNNVNILCRCHTGPDVDPDSTEIRNAIDLLFEKLAFKCGQLLGVGAQARVYKLEGFERPSVIKIYSRIRGYEEEKGYRGDASVMRIELHPNLCLPNSLVIFTPGKDHDLRIADEPPQPGEKVIASIYDELPTSISLLQLIVVRQGLQRELVRYLGKQVLDGLLHLHQRSFLHRDLKPDNIFITKNYEVKIIDFGMSRDLRGERSMTFSGTPAYLAPEILLESQDGYDFRAEVWALGAILYKMASGQFAFQCNTPFDLILDHAKYLASAQSFSAWKEVGELDSQLAEVLDSCLVYRWEDRPPLAEIASLPYFQEVPEIHEQLDINAIKERLKEEVAQATSNF